MSLLITSFYKTLYDPIVIILLESVIFTRIIHIVKFNLFC